VKNRLMATAALSGEAGKRSPLSCGGRKGVNGGDACHVTTAGRPVLLAASNEDGRAGKFGFALFNHQGMCRIPAAIGRAWVCPCSQWPFVNEDQTNGRFRTRAVTAVRPASHPGDIMLHKIFTNTTLDPSIPATSDEYQKQQAAHHYRASEFAVLAESFTFRSSAAAAPSPRLVEVDAEVRRRGERAIGQGPSTQSGAACSQEAPIPLEAAKDEHTRRKVVVKSEPGESVPENAAQPGPPVADATGMLHTALHHSPPLNAIAVFQAPEWSSVFPIACCLAQCFPPSATRTCFPTGTNLVFTLPVANPLDMSGGSREQRKPANPSFGPFTAAASKIRGCFAQARARS
jgi:hypothetical protein